MTEETKQNDVKLDRVVTPNPNKMMQIQNELGPVLDETHLVEKAFNIDLNSNIPPLPHKP